MAYRSFRKIASLVQDSVFKAIYERIQEKDKNIEGSLKVEPVVLDTETVNYIKDAQYQKVLDNFARDGVTVDSLSSATKKMASVLPSIQDAIRNKSTSIGRMVDAIKHGKDALTQDGYFNALTGTGVTGFDPGTFDTAYTPISMSPNEATSYYSSGGLPSIIVDKKAKGALLNGYSFESTNLSSKDRGTLKEYAQSVNFDHALERGVRDGLIYGGSFLYPSFKKDNPLSYDYPLPQLIKEGFVEKDSIDYFVTGDRWNTVMVPNYDITAKDYLSPESYFIPIGGVKVNAQRMAIIRPLTLPYWGTLRQLGWGRPDYEGYARSLLAYKVLITAIPIMAQQMSLLVNVIPMDGLMAQNGPDAVESFVQKNNARLRAWSMNNPITVNSYGTIEAINRSFADFDKLNMALRQDVAANSGIPESALFHSQATGFSNNSDEISYKQSETIRSIGNAVIPCLQPVVRLLVYSCFGLDSEQAKYASSVRISFDSPEIITNDSRGMMFEKFTSGINLLNTAGVNVHDAFVVARKFMPEIEIPDEVMNALNTENPPVDQPKPNPEKPGYKPDPNAKTALSKEGKNNA
jgi:hypothetical protein